MGNSESSSSSSIEQSQQQRRSQSIQDIVDVDSLTPQQKQTLDDLSVTQQKKLIDRLQKENAQLHQEITAILEKAASKDDKKATHPKPDLDALPLTDDEKIALEGLSDPCVKNQTESQLCKIVRKHNQHVTKIIDSPPSSSSSKPKAKPSESTIIPPSSSEVATKKSSVSDSPKPVVKTKKTKKVTPPKKSSVVKPIPPSSKSKTVSLPSSKAKSVKQFCHDWKANVKTHPITPMNPLTHRTVHFEKSTAKVLQNICKKPKETCATPSTSIFTHKPYKATSHVKATIEKACAFQEKGKNPSAKPKKPSPSDT